MTSTAELQYNQGKDLSPQPDERTLYALAVLLDQGHTVSVTLQPGDATRYELLLTPLWSSFVNLGNWGDEDRANGIIVTRYVSGTPHTHCHPSIVLLNRDWHNWSELSGGNAWSAKLFEWWFGKLAATLTEVRNA